MKIPIVEDEALIGLGLADELAEAGQLVVGPVPSTGSALIVAEKQQPTLALIDLDLRYSRDAGALARTLKHSLGVQSVFLASEPHLAEPYADSASGVLAKPFDVADVPAVWRPGARAAWASQAP